MPDLPKTTDPRLLAAIPQMQPWPEASGKSRWVLREPGRQYLVYSPDKSELDLSTESGSFQAQVFNPRTGREMTPSQTVHAGKTIALPAGVVWLVKD
jgi:hypothetical protein